MSSYLTRINQSHKDVGITWLICLPYRGAREDADGIGRI